jgi:hypothetical protein
MKRTACLVGVLLAGLTGCVDRRYTVITDPPGAIVLRDGKYIGPSPADDHFTYYGKRRFTLIKDGYQTQTVEQEIPAPWYQYFPLDFFTEVVIPWRITDKREFRYQMQPQEAARSDVLLDRAQNLRGRGQAITPAGSPDVPLEESMPDVVMPRTE